MGDGEYGISNETVMEIATRRKSCKRTGHRACVWSLAAAIFFAGSLQPPRAWSAQALTIWACLPTVMNALAMQNALEKLGPRDACAVGD